MNYNILAIIIFVITISCSDSKTESITYRMNKKRSLKFENIPDSRNHWTNDPETKGYFKMSDFPNDLQVVIHDGGSRISKNNPELIWVRTIGRDGHYFEGTSLNAPYKLKHLKAGDLIYFQIINGGEHPHLITKKYIEEREDWMIGKCNKCGFHELFDAPSDLISATFDIPINSETEMKSLTTFCNMCGGIQVVEKKK